MSSGAVLVVARHGGYALELRRAGLLVVEPGELDDTGSRSLAACVVDAVGPSAPEPTAWAAIEAMLRGEGAPPVVAVVSYPPPGWLSSLTPLAVLVSAPISGRVLVQHVTTAIARTSTVAPATGHEQHVIDLRDVDEPALAEVDRSRPEPVAVQGVAEPLVPQRGRARRRDRAAPSLSVPLRMARLGELVDRLAECLATTHSVHDVGESLAAAVCEQLSADVAVLVSRRQDAPWTVLAGVGLRPLEWRPVPRELPVLALLDARRPILSVESSDDVRQQAAGLPCVSRQHLIVARYPSTDVVLAVGRDGPPFTGDDVRVLGQAMQHEGGWSDALMMRDLAELLLPYLDA